MQCSLSPADQKSRELAVTRLKASPACRILSESDTQRTGANSGKQKMQPFLKLTQDLCTQMY